ncbi:amidohydrolase family protein [Steroidobacter sp.]|uniref:amidohydrolase family protein n=1 Tax=Steroidobacter sp. TaxID=1978227 RepID=UPI001A4FA6AA|nr:amidohydrolase family protein [Steroidobacter sp.]MBL8265893.1 PD40 domain-containing protein [Steroidobacter sp.]
MSILFGLIAAGGAVGSLAAATPEWDIANTGQPVRELAFTTTQGTWMSLDVSPDGRSIVFDLLGDIYAIDAKGGEARVIHGGPAMQRTPSFSADGRKLLYVSDVDGTENVWMSNVDGTQARQVTHETANLVMSASWGPDPQSVAVAMIEGRYPKRFEAQIALFDVAGGRRVLVPAPPNHRDVAEPVLSRDGRYVYYTERLAKDFAIYIDGNHINYAVKRRELASGTVEELATGWGSAFAPRISPDGKQLAFVRRVMDKTVLFVMDVETKAQRAVYDGLDRDLQAAYEAQVNYYPAYGWFPDNRHVAIWGKGELFKIDVIDGTVTPIPFRADVRQRVTEPVRFEHELAPATFPVRAIRHLAPSPDGQSMVFTALGQLWRKSLPASTPVRFGQGPAFAFEPRYSRDGSRVVYVEWDDERGSALKIATKNGTGAKTVVTSSGVIRQPSFSADGKRIAYRIQEAEVSMGGMRTHPGVYWVAASGGDSHRVSKDGASPQFSPDGERIYFSQAGSSDGGAVQLLISVTLDGLDRREHARTVDADVFDLRPSPDLRWIAFRDRQQYYVTPYRETGRSQSISAASDEAPVRRLTKDAGDALAWSPDSATLHWVQGANLYRATVSGGSGDEIAGSYATIGLDAKADIPVGTVAFTNARIITMQGDQVIENGSIVVSGNRIVAVGSRDTVAIPAGAKVIDASGKTIMPGLIDAHGHIDCCFGVGVTPQKQPMRYAALAFGVTTNFDPYPTELTSFESTETTLAGITVGPRWIGTGSALWGRRQQTAHVPVDSYSDAQLAIARKQALGAFIVKSYRYPSRKQRQMLVKAGRAAGVMVDLEGESQFYNNITGIIDGHTNLEHNLPFANFYDDIVQFMARAKAHNTPTLVVNFGELFGDNYMYQTTQAWKDPKVQLYVQESLSGYSPLGTPYGAPPHARAMTSIQAADEIWNIGFRAVSRAVKRLDDAGVVINAGSHGEMPGLAMHWEMALLAEGGMSNLHVLRAATLNTATTLGIDRHVGSIEAGKLADLIVLDANPLEDIHHSNSVRYTMVNGRLFDSLSMNEIGNYDRPRGRFYWELQQRNGIDWKEAWGGR